MNIQNITIDNLLEYYLKLLTVAGGASGRTNCLMHAMPENTQPD
ncbi:hypothetical protein PG2049B_1652 [Bifidobacterium pseudolongum subsp. globosum]|uniref:Uncharacterized protein n=1 Tax=Bifidobacterium pseudolongum subsp. globosum TaxID=1690 RepID=A0A4Q5AIF5_9BIFI|nr:hypothetical protein [Bifidobacterium pseudolongum]RYQ21016.1 hypothetical protein PG2049B_1652 [Bifidobacterium pseudolongum subsp. globosum]RYQ29427.1 hypothetical protein PG2017B_1616 [Bifidobacterium pseudolongum subsp. globosum]